MHLNNNWNNINKKFWKKFKQWFNAFIKPNTFQFILIWYAVFCLVGAGLLMSSGAVNWGPVTNQNHYNFWSALFTATSAFSDTGLVVTPTDTTFKPFGQVVIYLLILFGGVGLFVLLILLYRSFFPKQKLRFNTIVVLQSERGGETLNNVVKLIVSGVVFIMCLNIVCSLLLMFCFYYIPAHLPISIPATHDYADPYYVGFSAYHYERVYHNWTWSFWNGMFDSISALDNAGFSLFGESSMTAYRNGIGVLVQFILMSEWFIGGIGYPVIYEIYLYFKSKIKHTPFKFSLFSKMCLIGFFSLLVISTCLAYIFAYSGNSLSNGYSIINVKNYDPYGHLNTIYSPWGVNPNANKNWAIFWNCASTRSAGFDSYNLNTNSQSSKILYTILMYIGSSPSSTGGGIRITTFIIVLCSLFIKLGGRDKIVMFKKQISQSTISDSFLVMTFAIILIIITSFVVHFTYYGPNKELNNYINDFFVVSSAFGTCGLSLGNLLNYLHWGGILFLIITMFIGQLGVGSAILAVSRKHGKDSNYSLPVENVKVG